MFVKLTVLFRGFPYTKGLTRAFWWEYRQYVGEISSLPGKASRILVESRGLPSYSTCILEAEPGKLDIKRHKAGIIFIFLQVGSLFKLEIMT